MIYDFIYQNPPKATRSASIVEMALPEELQNLKIRESEKAKIIAKTAYEIKYGTDMAKDGYEMVSFSKGSADVYAGDPGTDADGGAKGPKPSILEFLKAAGIDWHVNPDTNTISFYEGDLDSIEYDKPDEERPTLYTYNQSDEVTNPDHYNQGKIDVIEGLYQMLPFEQFRGFMKGNIIKYTVRYEHKGHGKDLDKVEEYKRRLKEYERKEKML